MSAAPLRQLDELQLTVVVDNATDNLSTIGPAIPRVPEIASLLGRIPPTRQHDGHDCISVFDHLCVACHGFSVLARGRIGSTVRTVLFDVGPYGDVWIDNAERLGIDLAGIEIVFLSHWHWDHSGGFPVAIEAITEARRSRGIADPVVVDLHPDRPDQRGIVTPSGTMVMLAEEPTFAAISAAGGEVALHAESHSIADGFFWASGEIERVTAYETGLVGHHTFIGDTARPDPLILDERMVAARVRGRGVTVLSACSHAGVVNACLEAQRAFPTAPIDVVLGGYHLAGAGMEERIPATVADLQALVDPTLVAPAHCTGWRAQAALAEAFGPDRFTPSVVGTTFRLTAAPSPADASDKGRA